MIAAPPPVAAVFSVAQIARIVQVSNAVISPDGTRVAFVVSRTNLDRNRYDDQIQIYDLARRTARRIAAAHHSVSGLAWSPDGTKLAAVLDSGDSDELFTIDAATGAETQITNGSSVLDFAWSPGGGELAFTRREPAAHPTGAASFRDAFEVGDNAYLVTAPARPAHLWIADLAGKERRVTHGAWSVADAPLSWSPNGRYIIFERAASADHGVQDRATIVRAEVRTGTLRPLTSHTAYEDEALYSPDGTRITYLYSRGGDPANQTDAMALSASGGQDRDVTLALDRHVSAAAWLPGSRSLLLSVHSDAAMPLYVQPLSGAARRLPLAGIVTASIDPQQSVARNGAIAFTGATARDPGEVYVLAPHWHGPQRLTDYNEPIAALTLGKSVRVTWRGPQGQAEDGVLTYPPGYRAGRRYPLVLRIHGGPTESSTTAFEPFYQSAAARGYLVFAPNYRGSNDLGNAYERAIFNDASTGPGTDIIAGIHAVERMNIVDTTRIGVSGWSYGGQLTSWMEGHYGIFKAAVAGAAVNDLVVDYAIADDIDADAIGFSSGSPYKGNALAAWRAQSPITYFKNIHTPTLILCNVYDVRVPIVESYEMFHALRDNGVPVRFFAYPSTGHLPNGPVRLADAYTRWLGWFDRYLHPDGGQR